MCGICVVGVLDGSEKGSANIDASQLNDDVFNYIFALTSTPPASSTIPLTTLQKLRNEFEYWYTRAHVQYHTVCHRLLITVCMQRVQVPNGSACVRQGPDPEPSHDVAVQPRRGVGQATRLVAARLLHERARHGRGREDEQIERYTCIAHTLHQRTCVPRITLAVCAFE